MISFIRIWVDPYTFILDFEYNPGLSYLFSCSSFSAFAHWGLLQVGFRVHACDTPASFCLLPSSMTGCSSLMWDFPCPIPLCGGCIHQNRRKILCNLTSNLKKYMRKQMCNNSQKNFGGKFWGEQLLGFLESRKTYCTQY